MYKPKVLSVSLLIAVAANAVSPAAPDLGWLSGHWCSRDGDRLIEEYWLPSAGDLALGVSRTVRNGKTTSFEFLRIEFRDAGIDYVAQPQGGERTAFRLTASGTGWARFENRQHDFPQRVEYRRTAAGLHAEIAGPDAGGKQLVMPFEYTACTD